MTRFDPHSTPPEVWDAAATGQARKGMWMARRAGDVFTNCQFPGRRPRAVGSWQAPFALCPGMSQKEGERTEEMKKEATKETTKEKQRKSRTQTPYC